MDLNIKDINGARPFDLHKEGADVLVKRLKSRVQFLSDKERIACINKLNEFQ